MKGKTAGGGKRLQRSGFHRVFDTNVDIRVRVLTIVARAGAIGNSLGFLANLILYGFNFVTGFCLFCALLVICYLFFGLNSRRSIPLGYLLLVLLDVLEFPLLTMTYGAVMYPYMMIGFLAVAMVSAERKRIFLCSALGVYDLGVIVYSSLRPYLFGPQDSVGLMGSAIITFAIAVFAVADLIIMWQTVYLVETTDADPLTRSLSREGFNKRAAQLLSSEPGTDFVLLYFNVVAFKTINTMFGIEGGNRFLQTLSQHLQAAPFAPVLVGRLNADRFVCLVKKEGFRRSSLDDVCRLRYSEKGRAILAQLYCGIYEISNRELSVSSMCDRASSALDFIRGSGSKFYAEYDKAAAERFRDETEVFGEVGAALGTNQFVPFYQPIVSCATLQVTSAEALARWIHPEMGLISPAVFIPVLEKKDLISDLDRIICRRVHSFVESCRHNGNNIVPISVNLSRMDLYDRDMISELYAMLEDSDRALRLHNYEITESAYEDISAETLSAISALRQKGARILVDDFGNGYSSLGMITDYEFDVIKLDMAFTRKVESSEKVRGVVQSLIDMAHKLGAKVTAEGVETEEQFQILKSCGCDYAQGFYFYKPLSEQDFFRLLNPKHSEEIVGG